MSKKKSKKVTLKNRFNAAIDKTKNVAKKANNFALDTTEEVISESINIAGQWQGVATKAMKEGFKLSATQQDIFFDALDSFKAQFTRGKKRFKKVFA